MCILLNTHFHLFLLNNYTSNRGFKKKGFRRKKQDLGEKKGFRKKGFRRKKQDLGEKKDLEEKKGFRR